MKTIDLDIKKNEFLRQFEARAENDKLIKLEYSEQGKNLFLTRLKIDADLDYDSYSTAFLKSIFDNLSEKETKIVPTCPKVASFYKKNRSTYKHMLPAGINL